MASRSAAQEVSGAVAPPARSVAACRYLFAVASASVAIPSRPRSGAVTGLSAKARRNASAAAVPASAEAPAKGLAISPRLISPISPKVVSMPTAASASRIRPVKASIRAMAPFSMASIPSSMRFAAENTRSPITAGRRDQISRTANRAPSNVLAVALPNPTTLSMAPAMPAAASDLRS